MRRGPIVLGAVVATMAAAPAASAATPSAARSERAASLAGWTDGSGHVVWTTDGDNARVGYRPSSAGAESCNRTDVLSFGTATGALAAARPVGSTPAPNKVVIAGTCLAVPGRRRVADLRVDVDEQRRELRRTAGIDRLQRGHADLARLLARRRRHLLTISTSRVEWSNTPAAPTVGIDYSARRELHLRPRHRAHARHRRADRRGE